MPAANDTESRIRELDEVIGRLYQEASRLGGEQSTMSQTISRLRPRLRYLQFLRWFRSPLRYMELWPVAVLIVGPLIAGSLALMLLHLLFGFLPVALGGFVIGAAVGLGGFAIILYRPNDLSLEAAISDIDSQLTLSKRDFETVSQRSRLVKEQLKIKTDERAALISSVRYQREQLLRYNWRAMRGTEWEEYLAQVFSALGGKVELTGKAGDQGVDLVVELGNRRIAVQAKGYFNSVDNKAVQEVVAGMALYRCTACAVLTNSRFRKSAAELAASNRCILIGEDEFPAFVRGEIHL